MPPRGRIWLSVPVSNTFCVVSGLSCLSAYNAHQSIVKNMPTDSWYYDPDREEHDYINNPHQKT